MKGSSLKLPIKENDQKQYNIDIINDNKIIITAHGEITMKQFFIIPNNTFIVTSAELGDLSCSNNNLKDIINDCHPTYINIQKQLFGDDIDRQKYEECLYDAENKEIKCKVLKNAKTIFLPGDIIPITKFEFSSLYKSGDKFINGIFKIPLIDQNNNCNIILNNNIIFKEKLTIQELDFLMTGNSNIQISHINKLSKINIKNIFYLLLKINSNKNLLNLFKLRLNKYSKEKENNINKSILEPIKNIIINIDKIKNIYNNDEEKLFIENIIIYLMYHLFIYDFSFEIKNDIDFITINYYLKEDRIKEEEDIYNKYYANLEYTNNLKTKKIFDKYHDTNLIPSKFISFFNGSINIPKPLVKEYDSNNILNQVTIISQNLNSILDLLSLMFSYIEDLISKKNNYQMISGIVSSILANDNLLNSNFENKLLLTNAEIILKQNLKNIHTNINNIYFDISCKELEENSDLLFNKIMGDPIDIHSKRINENIMNVKNLQIIINKLRKSKLNIIINFITFFDDIISKNIIDNVTLKFEIDKNKILILATNDSTNLYLLDIFNEIFDFFNIENNNFIASNIFNLYRDIEINDNEYTPKFIIDIINLTIVFYILNQNEKIINSFKLIKIKKLIDNISIKNLIMSSAIISHRININSFISFNSYTNSYYFHNEIILKEIHKLLINLIKNKKNY
jgi:hypothetical protein